MCPQGWHAEAEVFNRHWSKKWQHQRRCHFAHTASAKRIALQVRIGLQRSAIVADYLNVKVWVGVPVPPTMLLPTVVLVPNENIEPPFRMLRPAGLLAITSQA
jgi:hypothetical protein